MERITEQKSKQFISLKDDYTGQGIAAAAYFTITPSDKGDGWEDVTYYTARKKNIYSNIKPDRDHMLYPPLNP